MKITDICSNLKKKYLSSPKRQRVFFFSLISAITLILLLVIIQKAPSLKIESEKSRTIGINNSFQNVKQILDNSMDKLEATYFLHQEISTPSSRNNTVSFVYYMNQGINSTIPTLDEVTTASKRSDEMRLKGQSLMLQAQEQDNNEMAQEAARILVEADRQMTQEDRFYTVEVAKDTNMPPIVLVHAGLPEWLSMKSRALALAEQHFGEPANIVSINRIGLGAHCIFIAVNSRGDSAFVDARAGKIFSTRYPLPSQRPLQKIDSNREMERTVRIQAQWQDFLKNGFDPKALSLEGLVDLSKQTKK